MKISFAVKDLKEVLGKMAGFVGATYVLNLTKRNTKEDATSFYARISASNGAAQATCALTYKREVAEDETVKDSFVFNNQFAVTVDNIGVFGDTITFEMLEGQAVAHCGTAVVVIPFAKDAVQIAAPDLKNCPTLSFSMSKADFAKAVGQGAYVNETSQNAAFNRTCYILPSVEPEVGGAKPGKKVKFISFSGFVYAECATDIAVRELEDATFATWAEKGVLSKDIKNMEDFFALWASKGIIVKAPALMAIMRNLTAETVWLHLTDGKLVISAGSDLYVFVAVEGSWVNLKKVFDKIDVKDFSLKVDKNQLKSAFKVIGLYVENADNRLMADLDVVETEAGKVKISVKDTEGKNSVDFVTEGHGNICFRLSKDNVNKMVDNTAGDAVTIYGIQEVEKGGPVFISGDNPHAISFTVGLKK